MIYNSLNKLKKVVATLKPTSIFVVTSQRVLRQVPWAKKIVEQSTRVKVVWLYVPDGEKAKEWHEVQVLLKKLSEHHADKKSLIIYIGGGSVGDLVGFVASLYLRGVTYVAIPSTLLAQVDSAIGGKNGVNFSGYKNQIGTVYNPEAIFIDKRFIKSLGAGGIIDGLGEIIKAGFIHDAKLLELLRAESVEGLKDSRHLEEIIKRTIETKLYYVAKDKNDAGVRNILNAGHTFGHSLELKFAISHGKSVILGMEQELEMTEALGLTKKGTKDNLLHLLYSLGIRPEKRLKADWSKIKHDKKVRGGHILFPTVTSIGKSKLIKLKLEILKKYV